AQAPQCRRVRRQVNSVSALDRVAPAQPVERVAGAAADVEHPKPLTPSQLPIEQRPGDRPHADVPPHMVFEIVHRAVLVFTHSNLVTSDRSSDKSRGAGEPRRRGARENELQGFPLGSSAPLPLCASAPSCHSSLVTSEGAASCACFFQTSRYQRRAKSLAVLNRRLKLKNCDLP